MLRGVLWDNDGVLVDTERFFYEVNRDLLREHGVELTERMFLDWYLRDNCGGWHLIPDVTPARIDALRAQRNKLYAGRLRAEAIPAMDGIEQVLTQLAPHVAMAVVTSSTPEHFRIVHDRLDLLRHFSFVLAADSYTLSKPSPEPYLLGLERLGMEAAECVVVEDSPRGLQAARAAGIRCIVLRHELTRGHDFDGAWRVVDTMAELLAALRELLRH